MSFFEPVASLLKNIASENNKYIYKVIRIEHGKEHEDINVYCEALPEGKLVTLPLKEIFKGNKLQYFSASDVLLLSNEFNSTKINKTVSCYDSRKYYNLIGLIFTLCLIVSNLAALRICDFFGFGQLDAGTIVFPVLYIMNDIINEIYGFFASRRIIWTALLANCLFSLFLYGVTFLPAAPEAGNQEAFTAVFALSPLIVVASVTSYFIGELVNASIISWLKIKFKGRLFIFRALFSTFIGSFIESSIFCTIAFSSIISGTELVNMILLLSVVKVVYEMFAMPITVRLVAFLKDKEQLNVFEKPSLKSFFPVFIR